jgi:hypothetical protein
VIPLRARSPTKASGRDRSGEVNWVVVFRFDRESLVCRRQGAHVRDLNPGAAIDGMVDLRALAAGT